MKKAILWICILSIFFWAGCSPSPTPTATPIPSQLPDAVKNQLETAIYNWNTIYGNNLQALSWTYKGIIDTSNEVNSILNQILDPNQAWIPKVNPNQPQLAKAFLLSNQLDLIPLTTRSQWENTVRSLIQTGMHLVEISWQQGIESFTTQCITNDSSIVYDNILSNAVLIQSKFKINCFDYTITWIWGSERGRIIADLNAICSETGAILYCSKNCSAYMSLGSAQMNCKTKVVGNCCVLEYSWAWGTPLVWISVKTDNFTLETSGLGSSGEGSGSCVECCVGEIGESE